MAKQELTQEQKDYRLDDFTLNNQFLYWIPKAKCIWSLKQANQKYNDLRETLCHSDAFENLKKQMFNEGIKD